MVKLAVIGIALHKHFSHSRLSEPLGDKGACMNDMIAGFTNDAALRLGRLTGFDDNGDALVAVSELPPRPADSLVTLTAKDIDCDLVVSSSAMRDGRLFILGRMAPQDIHPKMPGAVSISEAEDKVSIQCGKAKITLHADGRITVKGTEILSRATGANRIQGGSVNLN